MYYYPDHVECCCTTSSLIHVRRRLKFTGDNSSFYWINNNLINSAMKAHFSYLSKKSNGSWERFKVFTATVEFFYFSIAIIRHTVLLFTTVYILMSCHYCSNWTFGVASICKSSIISSSSSFWSYVASVIYSSFRQMSTKTSQHWTATVYSGIRWHTNAGYESIAYLWPFNKWNLIDNQ